MSVASVALAYVLRLPYVLGAIVGVRLGSGSEHRLETLTALRLRLRAEDVAQIDEASTGFQPPRLPAFMLPCLGCAAALSEGRGFEFLCGQAVGAGAVPPPPVPPSRSGPAGSAGAARVASAHSGGSCGPSAMVPGE